jgi:hypothetical protein
VCPDGLSVEVERLRKPLVGRTNAVGSLERDV